MNIREPIKVIDLSAYRRKSAERWRDEEERETMQEAWDRTQARLDEEREKYHARGWTLAIVLLCVGAGVAICLGWLP